MNESDSKLNGLNKYLRVFPILGLLLYYLGGLIASLEAANLSMFVIYLILFSLLELVGLFLRRKEVMIPGALLLIFISIGPIMSLADGIVGLIALGGLVMATAIIFHVLTIWAWIKS